MRILELHIERFGCLNNRHVDLSSGLNLVYGDNEAGKSTILSFIRAMFYGINGSARRISENERKLRMPWGQDRMGGWLVLEHGGRRYRIERTFSGVKRQDQRRLRDNTTGEAIALPGGQEIGEWLCQVSEAEFLNTVCIGQLATASVKDEDSTLAKLANLASTGDEQVSAGEVNARLRKVMVQYKAEKGGGGLIHLLAAQMGSLEQERQDTLQSEAERTAFMRTYQTVLGERDAAGALLAQGRHLQQICRDRDAVRIADQAAIRETELQALRQQAAAMSRTLQLDGRTCTWSDLAELRTRRERFGNSQVRFEENQQSFSQDQAALVKLNGRLTAYQRIGQVDAAACLALLEESEQLEQDVFAIGQRLLAIRTLQNSQATLGSQSDDAQTRCQTAQAALDAFHEQSAEDLRAAEADAAGRRVAWERCVAGLTTHSSADDAGQGSPGQHAAHQQARNGHRKRQPLLLAAGILLLALGIAGGLSAAPAFFALIPMGLVLAGLFFLLGRRTAAGLETTRDPVAAGAADSPFARQLAAEAQRLAQTLQESAERLDVLRGRFATREHQLAAELENRQRLWRLSTEQEREAVVEWMAALDRLQRDHIWQQPRILALTAGMTEALPTEADPMLVRGHTRRLAESLQALQDTLQQKLAASREEAGRILQDAGCETPDLFRNRLNEFQGLRLRAAELQDDMQQSSKALDDIAAENARMESDLRHDLLCLASESQAASDDDAVSEPSARPEAELDQLLESVRRRLTDFDSLCATIRAKETAAASAPMPEEDAGLAQARLNQAFPDGDAALATELAGFIRTAGVMAAANIRPDPSRLDATEQQDAAVLISAGAGQMPALLEGLHNRLKECSAEAARLESELTHRFSHLRSLEDIDADIEETGRRLRFAQSEHAALTLARETVDSAFQEMQQSFGPRLNQRGGDILARLSGGRYSDMRVDRSLQVSVPDPLTGQLHEADYLSGGTMDQAYLSLRLAVAELIDEPQNRLPLLLDDVLMQYDDQRADAGMAFLRQYAEEQDLQILLFTCHGRLLAGSAAMAHIVRLS